MGCGSSTAAGAGARSGAVPPATRTAASVAADDTVPDAAAIEAMRAGAALATQEQQIDPNTFARQPGMQPPVIYDYFLCHSNMDQEQLALPLFLALTGFGVEVFYDPWPANVPRKRANDADIAMGIHSSRCGIVAVTESLFADSYACMQAWSFLAEQGRTLPLFYSVHPDVCGSGTYGELGTALHEVALQPHGAGEIVNRQPIEHTDTLQFMATEVIPRLLGGVVRDANNALPTLPVEQIYDLVVYIQAYIMPLVLANPDQLPQIARDWREDLHLRGPDAVLYGVGPVTKQGQLLLTNGSTEGAADDVGIAARLWHVPERNPYFVGREQLLMEMDTAFRATGSACLVGESGIGKSAVAAEYVHQRRNEFSSVLWIAAESANQMRADYMQMAADVGLVQQGHSFKSENVVDMVLSSLRQHATEVERAHQFKSHHKLLIVFDNAQDYDTIKPFIPGFNAMGGWVMITSRNPKFKNILTVTPFTPAESINLIMSIGGYNALQTSALSVEQKQHNLYLAEALQNVPLAVALAAKFCAETGATTDEYGHLLLRAHVELWGNNAAPASADGEDSAAAAAAAKAADEGQNLSESRKAVFCAVHVARSRIAIDDQQAVEVHNFLAFLSHRNLERRLVDTWRPDANITFTLANLQKYHLIEDFSEQTTTFTMHPIVQLAVRSNRAFDAKSQFYYCGQAVETLDVLLDYSASEPLTWPLTGKLLPHVRVATDHALMRSAMLPDKVCRLLALLGGFASHVQVDDKTAIALYVSALDVAENAFGENDPRVAAIVNKLGVAFHQLGDDNKAIALYKRALVIGERNNGPVHPLIATRLNNLGLALSSLGKYTDALPVYQRALDITKTVSGDHHPAVATRLNNLAGSYFSLGRYEKAINLYEGALEIQERANGVNHITVARCLNNLGSCWYYLGQYEKAINLYLRAQEIDRNAYYDTHPHVAANLNQLGRAWFSLGKYDMAVDVLQQSFNIQNASLGPEHPLTVGTLEWLDNAKTELDHRNAAAAAAQAQANTASTKPTTTTSVKKTTTTKKKKKMAAAGEGTTVAAT